MGSAVPYSKQMLHNRCKDIQLQCEGHHYVQEEGLVS